MPYATRQSYDGRSGKSHGLAAVAVRVPAIRTPCCLARRSSQTLKKCYFDMSHPFNSSSTCAVISNIGKSVLFPAVVPGTIAPGKYCPIIYCLSGPI